MSEFSSTFAENIFRLKYALTRYQTWKEKADDIVNDVCGRGTDGLQTPILAKDERQYLAEQIRLFRFLPAGRYIYYAGREARFWNNCFDGATTVLTDKGFVGLEETVGQSVNVLSPVDGEYYPAEIVHHGRQKVNKLTFTSIRGKSTLTYEVRATRNHHWLLMNGSDTYDIRVGDVVPANGFSRFNSLGYIHGLIYGDGTFNRARVHSPELMHTLRLCGGKNRLLDTVVSYLEENKIRHTVTYPPHASLDAVITIWLTFNGKELPETNDPSYVSGFIRGWIAADSCEKQTHQLASCNETAIDYFAANAACAGIVITGLKRAQIRDTAFAKKHKIFLQNYAYGEAFLGFKLVSIEPLGEFDVYCPYEPVHGQIVIDHGIRTFNCFLLKGLEDTREEWGNLANRVFSCLMVGGGIGVDYSVFRPEGMLLSRTGGTASGPIPLMHSINEIGRNVCQGGSRRSAIYGSLNWQHADAGKFLRAKDWHNMPVGKDGYTVWDAKADDFNFHAPLDMTNISLNYDDAWLNEIAQGTLPATYLDNIRQALMTGDPGMSFNFGDKANETCRNACCELTSEDDSDVCNLGSVNIGAIDSLEDFKSLTQIAAKFLICGTMRGQLPYQKVKDVRDQNRRIGLGLMGIHEWLLKRDCRYEFTPELHRWFGSYQTESEVGANAHCDRFYLNRPKGYRAIAPTGTIAILAGTTTGIEPLYSVAYKRRYLANSSQWRYETVVDATAQVLIDRGINPDRIETASDLAQDPERRIKFQYDAQKYVDHAISSTINLPAWGSAQNNEDHVIPFATTLAKYAHGLRGFTCYPDGSRGGQPITAIPYAEAIKNLGMVFEENSACKDGVCGI